LDDCEAAVPIKNQAINGWAMARIKLDSFHTRDRLKRGQKKKHGMYYLIFCAILCDASFSICPEDMEWEIKLLAKYDEEKSTLSYDF
jgi:hypothetical protein